MRLATARVVAAFSAVTWLFLPGFGLTDLSVTWDEDWAVVLEASWGTFMTVLVGGSFLAVVATPRRPAPALVTLGVSLLTWLVAVAVGLEPPLLFFIAILTAELALLTWLLAGVPGRESLLPGGAEVRWPLLVVAATGAVPWLWHAERMFRASRRNAGETINELTMNVDHYTVQGAWALALPTLALLAACWPRGRRHLGLGVGLSAGYVGLVSSAFPGTWGGFSPSWSVACMAWAAAVTLLALVPSRSEPGQLRGQVVEAQRAL
ncbi:hypothetical protein [Blastococcus brunescens]|uniref:hypothetical protein n=1 Tax=Blastococcus brunescens TaxID=1564165 RepID=UPI003BEF2A07